MPVAVARVAAVCSAMCGAFGPPLGAQDTTIVRQDPPARPIPRQVWMGAAMLGAATFNQATAMPSQWKRTWRGYGARLGDQVGFGVTEEVLRMGLASAIPWTEPAMTCDGARRESGAGFWRRVGSAATCGVVNTLVVRNAEGERRPNVPLLGAIAGASAVSLAWRPERVDAGKGRLFVLTRIGVVSGGTALKEAYTEFRAR